MRNNPHCNTTLEGKWVLRLQGPRHNQVPLKEIHENMLLDFFPLLGVVGKKSVLVTSVFHISHLESVGHG